VNRLKMANIDSILTLHQRRWSIRRIAKELGIHRDTVARHIHGGSPATGPPAPDEGASACKLGHPAGGAHDFKLGQALIGAEASAEGSVGGVASASAGAAPAALAALAPAAAPSAATQASLCEPWRSVIVSKLQGGLTAQRIFQDLVREHGFAGKYHSVRRFVRRLGHNAPLPFRRMECAPGDEAQVDFGVGIPIRQLDGRKRRTHVFRATRARATARRSIGRPPRSSCVVWRTPSIISAACPRRWCSTT
jgi:hypothetical protein